MIWAHSSLQVPNNYLGSAIFTSWFEISGAAAEQCSVHVQNNPNLYLYHLNVCAMLAWIAKWGLCRCL